SRLPLYSNIPSPRHLTTSPVRYSPAPAFPLTPSGTYRTAVSSRRLKYPRPTPPPPRYNSPGTPTPNSLISSSFTYTSMLLIGPPIVPSSSSPPSPIHLVTSTAASVGPYRL